MNIRIRQHPQYGHDVIFVADGGQIICRYQGCAGMISFDGKAERLTLNESADYSSTTVFARYAGAITNKLKLADETVVELTFYQSGNPQFTFETAGLEWPPKGDE